MTGRRKIILFCLVGCLAAAPGIWLLLRPAEVYQTCIEIESYYRETIELRSGSFRYWRYSDAEGEGEESFPVKGSYTLDGNRLTLHYQKLGPDGVRILDEIRGRKVLWKLDAWEEWKRSSRIHWYGIAIRTASPRVRPSVHELYTPEMMERERAHREEALADVPGEAGALLRAATGDRSDTDSQYRARLDAYRSLLTKVRENLDPVLLGQLVALMGYDSKHGATAERVLNDLYFTGGKIGEGATMEDPQHLKDAAASRRALTPLIDACAHARDSRALEKTLLIFLRVSGIPDLNLPLPKVGVRIFIAVTPEGSTSSLGSLEGSPITPRDYRWREELEYIIPVCQDWMRRQIGER